MLLKLPVALDVQLELDEDGTPSAGELAKAVAGCQYEPRSESAASPGTARHHVPTQLMLLRPQREASKLLTNDHGCLKLRLRQRCRADDQDSQQ